MATGIPSAISEQYKIVEVASLLVLQQEPHNNPLHTEPRAARFWNGKSFAAAR